MMCNHGERRISYMLLRVMVSLHEADRKVRRYGTDHELHFAEIHMIKAIRENDGIHVTGLAEKLGVTKGAVSQMIARLLNKGMIVKDTDEHNMSRLSLRLTPAGEIAHANHENEHRMFDRMVNDALANATPENIAFLDAFLEEIEKRIDETLKNI